MKRTLPDSLWSFAWRETPPRERVLLVAVSLLVIGAVVCKSMVPEAGRWFVDDVTSGRVAARGLGAWSIIASLGWLLVFYASYQVLLYRVAHLVMGWTVPRVSNRYRQRLLAHSLRVPSGTFHGSSSGAILRRINDFQRGVEGFGEFFLWEVVDLVVLCLMSGILLGRLHPGYVALAVLWFGSQVALTLLASRSLRRSVKSLAAQQAEASSKIGDLLANVVSVRAHGQLEAEDRAAQVFLGEAARAAWVATRSAAALKIAHGVSQVLLILALAGTAGWLTASGELTAPDFILIFGFVYRLTNESWGFSGKLLKAIENLTTAVAAYDFFRGQPALVFVAEERPLPRNELAPVVRFEDVRFSYDGEAFAVRDVSLEIRRGESVAVVGPSGAGKSTLLSLMIRLVEPDAGQVQLAGHLLSEWPSEAFGRYVTMVHQDATLFDRSLGANAAYGNGSPRADALRAALEAAAADFAIERGLDAGAGERGCALSRGQRQRVLLARALLHEGELLLVDEGDSAVDASARAAVRARLRRALARRTAVVVTHDLAFARSFERIIVMDRGRVVGDGAHASLMSRCAIYQGLVGAEASESLAELAE